MRSPCLTCDFIDESKNDERCENCQALLEYNIECGNLPPQVLEKDWYLSEKRKRQEEREKWEPIRRERDEYRINLRQHGLFPDSKKILKEVREIATKEFRGANEQVLIFLKIAIEQWKKEHEENA